MLAPLLLGIVACPLDDERIAGAITDASPIVRTPALDASELDDPTLGLAFARELPPGDVTIELRSWWFDAYLVVRAADGTLLAEDDDGLLRTHSRIMLEADAPRSVVIEACALHGRRGAFELAICPGRRDPPSGRDAVLEDARTELREREAALGAEHLLVADSLDEIADGVGAGGEIRDAFPLLRRALAIREKSLGPDHPDTARTVNNLAVALLAAAEYEEALQLARRALASAESQLGPLHEGTAAAQNNVADALRNLGRVEEAVTLYQRSLGIREEVLGPEHPDTASSLSNLSAAFLAQGKVDEALPICRRALSIREKNLGSDHPDTATSLNNVASMLWTTGRAAEALPLYERALAIHERTFGPDHRETATALNNLATLLASVGRHDEALRFHQRALDVKVRTLGAEHPATASAHRNMAAQLQLQGRPAEALPLLERALAIDEKVLGAEHPLTATVLRELVHVELDLGHDEAAGERARELLARQWRSSLQRSRRVPVMEVARLVAGVGDALDLALSAAIECGSAEAAAALLPEVIAFKDALRQETAARREGVRVAADAELDARLERLAAARAALSDLFSIHEVRDRRQHERDLERLRRERIALESEVAAALAGRAETKLLATEEIAAALPSGAALLVFLNVTRHRASEVVDGRVLPCPCDAKRMHAWIVRADTQAAWIDLGPTSELDAAVKAVLDPYGTTSGVAARGDALAGARAAARLRARLWDPLVPLAGGADRLFVSPDGVLSLLPFGLIEETEGRHLIERSHVVLLDDVTSSVRHAPPAARAAAPSLLLAGAVDYDEADSRRADEGGGAPVEGARGSIARAWIPLLESRREISGIARLHALHHPGATRLVLVESEACEERLKTELPRHAVLHLATHGYFLAEGLRSLAELLEEPAERAALLSHEREVAAAYFPAGLCGVVCAGANAPQLGRDNGLLTGEEVSGLDLSRCDLVVLSACETGLGASAFGAASGQGSMSLARAFRDAGARTVIASLWRVRDDSTRELMLAFYERLWTRGESKLAALRGAQLAMLQRNREKHGDTRPATWSAFVLTGEAE